MPPSLLTAHPGFMGIARQSSAAPRIPHRKPSACRWWSDHFGCAGPYSARAGTVTVDLPADDVSPSVRWETGYGGLYLCVCSRAVGYPSGTCLSRPQYTTSAYGLRLDISFDLDLDIGFDSTGSSLATTLVRDASRTQLRPTSERHQHSTLDRRTSQTQGKPN
jgi:hypothetical protein